MLFIIFLVLCTKKGRHFLGTVLKIILGAVFIIIDIALLIALLFMIL